MKNIKIDNNYDAIVIGSGLGGLFASAKLSKEGKRVLLRRDLGSPPAIGIEDGAIQLHVHCAEFNDTCVGELRTMHVSLSSAQCTWSSTTRASVHLGSISRL